MPLLKFSHFAPGFELFGLGGIRVFFDTNPQRFPARADAAGAG